MAQENIKFPRQHMAIRDEYFFYFDERNNTLNKKVCDGNTAFTYPLETPLGSNQVKTMEYDGYYFWTLQQGATDQDSIIKKWIIENFVCKLVDIIDLSHTLEDIFNCSTFSLEYYTTTLTTTVSGRDTHHITLNNYYDKVESGTILTLGPNNEGFYEDVTVTGTINGSDTFGLDFYTFNTYEAGTEVYFPKSVWLVNDYTHNVLGGSLYKITLPNERIGEVIEDEDFEYVNASCFYNTGTTQYVLYVLGTVVRFFNINTNLNETSMLIDNIKDDQVSVITVYDIKVEEDTLYRLQHSATYYGTDYSWGTYNYQVSTLRSFIDSVTVDVTPKILPSNGINVAEITSVVRDQYNNPAQFRIVMFQDTDPTGFVTNLTVYTGLDGVATSYYKAGVVPASVVIRATATQYD